jgi:hypothetical protein
MKAIHIDTIKLLRDVGWANSNGESRRMIASKGLRIDNEIHTELDFFFTGSEFIMQFGRKYIRIIIPVMKQWYNDDARIEHTRL